MCANRTSDSWSISDSAKLTRNSHGETREKRQQYGRRVAGSLAIVILGFVHCRRLTSHVGCWPLQRSRSRVPLPPAKGAAPPARTSNRLPNRTHSSSTAACGSHDSFACEIREPGARDAFAGLAPDGLMLASRPLPTVAPCLTDGSGGDWAVWPVRPERCGDGGPHGPKG